MALFTRAVDLVPRDLKRTEHTHTHTQTNGISLSYINMPLGMRMAFHMGKEII